MRGVDALKLIIECLESKKLEEHGRYVYLAHIDDRQKLDEALKWAKSQLKSRKILEGGNADKC